jgi:hypothetical protein
MSKFRVTFTDGSYVTIDADAVEHASGSGMTNLTKGDKLVASFAGGTFQHIVPADAMAHPAPPIQRAVNEATNGKK